MYRIERMVPLVGPTVAGPLGVVHLPRMWLKGVLSAAGMLAEGYFDYYKGFNQRVVDGLGLDPVAWFEFLATMPTYPEAEDYVRAHATALNPASIAAVNAEILTRERPEEAAAAIRARAGLGDRELRNSARLIDYDDWCAMHETLVAHRDARIAPVVPMVSSSQTGMLGVPHLPRLWMKALLASVNALPEGWKTGTNCGFDRTLAATIGLDLAAACAFIASDLPNYVRFEAWVRDHIAEPDAATKAQWSAKILALQKSADQSTVELAEAGAPDLATRDVILINDLVDWKHMHDAAYAMA